MTDDEIVEHIDSLCDEIDNLTKIIEAYKAALYDIEQEALSNNHYGYAKKARAGLEKANAVYARMV